MIETLLAAGLLASALVAVAYVFAVAVRANDAARITTSAIVIAAQTLEHLRSTDYDDETAGEGVEYLDASGRLLEGGGLPAFVRRVVVIPLEWDPFNTMTIRVDVSTYREAISGASRVSLVTLKTRK